MSKLTVSLFYVSNVNEKNYDFLDIANKIYDVLIHLS
jgi:hypothetical protein